MLGSPIFLYGFQGPWIEEEGRQDGYRAFKLYFFRWGFDFKIARHVFYLRFQVTPRFQLWISRKSKRFWLRNFNGELKLS